MKLVIAEKKELANHIAIALSGTKSIKADTKTNSYEAGGYTVAWCQGHIIDLKGPEDYDDKYKYWDFDELPIEELSLGELKESEAKYLKHLHRSIPQLLRKASLIVNAGDPDEEGQRIIDNVLEFYKVPPSIPIKRVAISDTNPKLVIKAFQNLEDNNAPKWRGMSLRGRGRAIADLVYGLNMTRGLTTVTTSNQTLSMGRVQSPTFALAVKRYLDNKNFKPSDFFEIHGEFLFKDVSFSAKLTTTNLEGARLDQRGRFLIEDEVGNICLKIGAIDNKPPPTIENYTLKEVENDHPLVYSLIELQAEADERYGIDLKETLEITQALRDKYSLITYNRSDCPYLNFINHADADDVLLSVGKNLPDLQAAIEKADTEIISRVWNDKEVAKSAHHGIIPTVSTVNPTQLNTKERLVYELIAKRYLLQFYPKKRSSVIEFDVFYENYLFHKKTTQTVFLGWEELTGSSKELDTDAELSGEDETKALPELEEGEVGETLGVKVKKGRTTAPPLFTKRSLLLALPSVDNLVEDPKLREFLLKSNRNIPLNQRGIGTPATRADIVERIFEVKYVKLDSKKRIVPTALGLEVYDILPDSARKIDTSALWQFQLSAIAEDKFSITEFLDFITDLVANDLDDLYDQNITLSTSAKKVKCNCNEGYAIQKKGKESKNYYWVCKSCSSTFQDDGTTNFPDFTKKSGVSEIILKNEVGESFQCLKCDQSLALKNGTKGFFWACVNNSNCKTTYNDEIDAEGVHRPVLERCQAIGCKGILGLIPYKNSSFWSCSNYRSRTNKCTSKYENKDGRPVIIKPIAN